MSQSWRSVPEPTHRRALAAVESHDLSLEAREWPYVTTDVFEAPKTVVDRMNLADELKLRMLSDLADIETVILVSHLTSAQAPEPLTGGGTHYSFLVHPRSFALVGATRGRWRS